MRGQRAIVAAAGLVILLSLRTGLCALDVVDSVEELTWAGIPNLRLPGLTIDVPGGQDDDVDDRDPSWELLELAGLRLLEVHRVAIVASRRNESCLEACAALHSQCVDDEWPAVNACPQLMLRFGCGTCASLDRGSSFPGFWYVKDAPGAQNAVDNICVQRKTNPSGSFTFSCSARSEWVQRACPCSKLSSIYSG